MSTKKNEPSENLEDLEDLDQLTDLFNKVNIASKDDVEYLIKFTHKYPQFTELGIKYVNFWRTHYRMLSKTGNQIDFVNFWNKLVFMFPNGGSKHEIDHIIYVLNAINHQNTFDDRLGPSTKRQKTSFGRKKLSRKKLSRKKLSRKKLSTKKLSTKKLNRKKLNRKKLSRN